MKAKLISTTRQGESYRSKQNVYFACHPDDLATALQPISEDILSLQDCAIWHLDPPDGDIDLTEHLDRLSEMQAVVIPVTRKLLTTQNRAFDVEFSFAREHNILLLPILIEGGDDLISLFNQKCGNLYLLDKYCTDSTATPYKEKLQRFLSYALADEKQIEKIRKLLAARIFLSYRRVDREHAQRLIQAILSDESMRDVSIFFDEFLTPGQTFDSTIEHEIKQCDLFALNLTPNLIQNEQGIPNYVLREELPYAIAEKKTIIPVKTVEVDDGTAADILKIEKKSIIPLADETYNAAFLQALRRALKPYTDARRVFDPANPIHNYYLGVAYLRGVDVPVDREYGIQQINSAMEAGIEEMDPDIAKELARMYRYGQEVPYNIIRAIYFFGYYLRGTEKDFVTIEEKKRRMLDWAEYKDLCLMNTRDPDAARIGHSPVNSRGAIEGYEEMIKLQEEIAEELNNPLDELRKINDLRQHLCGLRLNLAFSLAKLLDVSEEEMVEFRRLAIEACEKHLELAKRLNQASDSAGPQNDSRAHMDIFRDQIRLRDAARQMYDARKSKENLDTVIEIAEKIAYGESPFSTVADINYLITLRFESVNMLREALSYNEMISSIHQLYLDLDRGWSSNLMTFDADVVHSIIHDRADALAVFVVKLVQSEVDDGISNLSDTQKIAAINEVIKHEHLNSSFAREFWIAYLREESKSLT